MYDNITITLEESIMIKAPVTGNIVIDYENQAVCMTLEDFNSLSKNSQFELTMCSPHTKQKWYRSVIELFKEKNQSMETLDMTLEFDSNETLSINSESILVYFNDQHEVKLSNEEFMKRIPFEVMQLKIQQDFKKLSTKINKHKNNLTEEIKEDYNTN